jgi:Glycosyltransferase (GlcNAc)
MKERIFVQIAAYRDSELLPTLADCLARAADPSRLRFGLCWQREEGESLGAYATDERFRVIEVDYQKSMGACWARHRLQQCYDGEEYTLQLDSHHRFVAGWDDRLIAMLRNMQHDYAKPILTSYAPTYDPTTEPQGRSQVPFRIDFVGFSSEGPVQTRPSTIDEFRSLSAPIPARFYSAHFAFTTGRFTLEVPHDPKLYFFGEEPSLAVRAFTHGYDLFHPHEVLLWHQYGRESAPKHWTDHQTWYFHDRRSATRTQQLLGVDGMACTIDFGPYGLGQERTLADFTRHTGIDYARRVASAHAIARLPPPEPEPAEEPKPPADAIPNDR